jgi:hypothetical protein
MRHKKHKITLGTQLKAMSFSFMGTLLMIGTLFYFDFNSNFVKVFFFFWLFYTIPATVVHIIYYLKNRDQQIEILNNELIYSVRNGEERKCSIDDLAKITLYKSASIDKGGIQLTPIESYHYACVTPKQGNEIIITCLLVPDIEKAIGILKQVPFERKKRLFCNPL